MKLITRFHLVLRLIMTPLPIHLHGVAHYKKGQVYIYHYRDFAWRDRTRSKSFAYAQVSGACTLQVAPRFISLNVSSTIAFYISASLTSLHISSLSVFYSQAFVTSLPVTHLQCFCISACLTPLSSPLHLIKLQTITMNGSVEV
jgi:hypothetical protein